MAIIRVTLGGCDIQYKDANGNARHVLKTPEDGPFECDDMHAESLVRMGVAEYVTAIEIKPDEDPEQQTGHLDPAELEKMDYNNLKKLAADLGVKPEGTKKADYIAAIAALEVVIDDDAIVGTVEGEEEADDMPDLSAADPE